MMPSAENLALMSSCSEGASAAAESAEEENAD
jgi:hypothetical protein